MMIALLAKAYNLGTFNGIGPLGNMAGAGAAKMFEKVISGIIGIVTIVAAIWFIFSILIAGFDWISSGGDKNKLEMARAKITQAVIGLVIVIAATFFISLIGGLIGLPDILKPGKFVNNFWNR